MKKLIILALALFALTNLQAQTPQEVLKVAQRANDYFMKKYSDPTVPTNVNRIRPSSLWTRAVYYEGLMELYKVDPPQRYIDYTDRWASFHQWNSGMARRGMTGDTSIISFAFSSKVSRPKRSSARCSALSCGFW